MFTILPLTSYHRPDLERLIRGYDSSGRYHVTWEDIAEETIFRTTYEALDTSIHKDWGLQEEDFERYRELIAGGHSLGAFVDGALAGLSINEVNHWNRSLWIWEFHVAREQRRQGIGLALIDANAGLARALGLRTMLVETANTNAAAIAFYRRAGFRLEGIDISHYTNHDLDPGGEVAFFLKRRIEP